MVERNLAKVEVAGPSPVFRSTKVIGNGGLFSYVSMGYAALAGLCRCFGLFLILQLNFGKSGEMRAISGECFTLCLTLKDNICKVKLDVYI